MNCDAARRWLNEGRSLDDGELGAHLRSCADCGEEARAQEALMGALRQRFATAPSSFVQRVTAQLPSQELSKPSLAPLPEAYPWYVSLLLEPSLVMGLLLGGVYALWGRELWALGKGWTQELLRASTESLAFLPASIAEPLILGVTFASFVGASFLLIPIGHALGKRVFETTPSQSFRATKVRTS